MKLAALVLVPLLALAPTAQAKTRPATTHGVAKAALIAAAKAAPLRLIDALEIYCDGETPIGAWLKALTASEVRSIAWSAGRCELVNKLNPLDEGGGDCAQATLTLKRPKDRRDHPEIEIYLDDAEGGKPGEAFAFRAMFDSNDGPDYIRFRKDFETEWRDRFKDAPAPPCTDE
jgi:hypothetical protein